MIITPANLNLLRSRILREVKTSYSEYAPFERMSDVLESGHLLVDDMMEFDEDSAGRSLRYLHDHDSETYNVLCEYAGNQLLDLAKRESV